MTSFHLAAGKSSFTMKKTVFVPSTLPLRPFASRPSSLLYPWLHISLYFGLPIRCLYSVIYPVSLSNTPLSIWRGKVLDESFMASSLGSSSWVIVGFLPSSDATNARGHAIINFFFCGVILGDGAEIGKGVKIVFITLGRASISYIAYVSSFVILLLMVLQTVVGRSPLELVSGS